MESRLCEHSVKKYYTGYYLHEVCTKCGENRTWEDRERLDSSAEYQENWYTKRYKEKLETLRHYGPDDAVFVTSIKDNVSCEVTRHVACTLLTIGSHRLATKDEIQQFYVAQHERETLCNKLEADRRGFNDYHVKNVISVLPQIMEYMEKRKKENTI